MHTLGPYCHATRGHRSERGATATEYGVLLLFVAMAVVLALTAFGDALDGVYSRLASRLDLILP